MMAQPYYRAMQTAFTAFCEFANEVFAPRPDEIAYAQKIIDAARDAAARGESVFTLDGQMIDEPMIARSRAILDLASKSNTTVS